MAIADEAVTSEILAVEQLEEAAHYLDLEPGVLMRVRHAEREIQLNLLLHRENGDTVIVRAYRVQHSSARGPCMGPLILSKERTVADLRADALKRSLQYALWDLPFGGSSGLISIDIEEWSESELRQIVTSFATASWASGALDVITPSRAMPPQMMAWIVAAGSANREHLARVTGKPVSMGGIDRDAVAAKFLVSLTRSVTERSLGSTRVVFVGFDRLAQRTASEMAASGSRVVGVADSSGAIWRGDGLDVELLRKHILHDDVVFGFAEAESIPFDELLSTECDVLVLNGANSLSAKAAAEFVIESASTTPAACELAENTIPAMIGDFGLSFADFLEWRKAECGFCSEREVARGMQAQIRRTWHAVRDHAREHQMSFRKSAEVIALSRLAESIRLNS